MSRGILSENSKLEWFDRWERGDEKFDHGGPNNGRFGGGACSREMRDYYENKNHMKKVASLYSYRRQSKQRMVDIEEAKARLLNRV